ncbi:32194_t:CDS:2, partial [Gigaspora margarita]
EQEALIEEEPKCSQRTQLISTVRQLPEEELPFTYNYMVQSLYKSKSDYCSLQDSNLRLEKKNKKLSQKNQELLK